MDLDASQIAALAAAIALVVTALGKAVAMVVWAFRH
jgi:hypothetical protein